MILNDRSDLDALRGTPDFGKALRIILGSTKTWINRAEPGEEPDWQEVTVLDTLNRMEFTMDEFLAELASAGIQPVASIAPVAPQVGLADYARAIQAHIDAEARSRGYADGFAISSYVASTVPQWAAEATAFVAWRDAVWLYAYQELEKVNSGQRPWPALAALVAELPNMNWPSK